MTELHIVCQGLSQTKQGDNLLGWWSDVPLSTVGLRQSLLVAVRLQAESDITTLYTSPLRRAVQTAHVIADQLKVVPQRHEDLRELDCGSLDGLTYQEAYERFPDLVVHGPQAGGTDAESYGRLQDRVSRALGEIINRNPEGKIAVVTHGGSIVAYLRSLLGHQSSSTEEGPFFETSPASIHTLRFDADACIVVRLNDTSHLADGPN